ncbi:MAG: c-type cytochrome, partial [Verrucomicrobia bacterium]
LLEWVRHIARHGLPTEMDTVVRRLQSERDRSWERQVELFRAIQLGVEQRGGRAAESLGSWAEALATGLLGKGEPADPARLRAGAELAATFRVGSAEPTLAAIAAAPGAAPGVRATVLRALLAIRAEAHRGLAGEFLKDGNLPNDARAEVLQVLARENSPESRGLLVDVLRGASSRFGLQVATALCGSAEGAGAVLGAVADGRAPARFLAERAVKDRLLAVRPRDAELLERLAASARGDSGRLQKTLEERRDAFVKSPGNPDAGAKIFEANCVVCHSVKGHGGNIGPQLDGIGHRGLERLCEDVLNPNANVDRVFRYSVVTRANGEAFTGLFRREEGQLLVFVDATGKELPLPKAEILSRTESEASLMPDNFRESIAPDAFNDLLSFLLSQRK